LGLGIGIAVGFCLGLDFINLFVLSFFDIVELASGTAIGALSLLLFVAFLLLSNIFKDPVKNARVTAFLFAARQEKPADKLYQ